MRFPQQLRDDTPRAVTRETLRRVISTHGYRRGDQLPTYRDLSERLDVSLLTLQRAMNDLADEGIVYRLRSKGTFVARELAAGPRRLSQVGIVFYALRTRLWETPYLNEIMAGIMALCEAEDLDLQILSVARNEAVSPHRVAQRVDGVILLGIVNDDYIRAFARENVPVVVVDYRNPEVPLDYVVCDNDAAARRAMEHLFSLGHRRIAYMERGTVDMLTAAGAQAQVDSSDTIERREAYRAAMQDMGLIREAAVYKFAGQRDYMAQIQDAVRDVRHKADPPTAILAYDATTAATIMNELAAQGVRVPEDISLAAIGGAAADGLIGNATLTYSRFHFRRMGELAMQTLIRRCGSLRPAGADIARIGSVLLTGSTTGPAKEYRRA